VQITVVPYQGNVGMFLERPDFAQQAYVFSEPFVARQQGADPRCLMLSDIGFNPYTSVLIVRERTIAEDPDLVARMVRACVRGWRQYVTEPEAGNRLIETRNPEMGQEILAFGAREIGSLCLPHGMPPEQLGVMRAERWRQLAAQLREVDLLESHDVWQEAFDVRFLSDAQPPPLR
jgi:NitT/TauT family transport system substrate-binding protein